MTPEDFKTIREAASMTQQEVADYLGVHIRTAQRYEYEDKPIPKPIIRLMELLKEKFKGRIKS